MLVSGFEQLERLQAGFSDSYFRPAVLSQSIGQEFVGLALDVCSSGHLRQVAAPLAGVAQETPPRDAPVQLARYIHPDAVMLSMTHDDLLLSIMFLQRRMPSV